MQLAPAVIAATLTTVVVFVPMTFVQGLAADIFMPLGITVSFTLLASLAVALAVVPSMWRTTVIRTPLRLLSGAEAQQVCPILQRIPRHLSRNPALGAGASQDDGLRNDRSINRKLLLDAIYRR